MFHYFLFSQLLLLLSAKNGNGHHAKCPHSFDCGNLGTIRFPFTPKERPECGILAIGGCDNENPANKTIQLNTEGRQFNALQIDGFTIYGTDNELHQVLRSKNCSVFNKNYTLPFSSPLASLDIKYNITLFRCKNTPNFTIPKHFFNYSYCPPSNFYFRTVSTTESLTSLNSTDEYPSSLKACSTVVLPIKDYADAYDPFTFLSAEVPIEVRLSQYCADCYYRQGGLCQLDSNRKFYCAKEHKSWLRKLGLGLGIGLPGLLIVGFIFLWHKKAKFSPTDIQFKSRNTYTDFYTSLDSESGSANFGVPVFSYKELQKATDNFDRTRELGDGGFGIVYYGKLTDGREVAVKRLYEHNYKRVKQFLNEIEILTRLRHRNLVSLYGCTSRHSRELLLVYEYIPNGTVASHLHSDVPKPGLLPWPIRIKVAIETATALAYLHASDIIHRDVKSNNILLDNSYCVKVADFGLSRLFPNDVTHVSTAPQGTPGYVDPEYHNCYQLTSKSDVYSFGVVLIELISSMPAVDMTRDSDEINLANLAIKKIQKSAISELVDPSLGFESESEVKRMIVSVAELAFQCLQRDKELRPSMDEVLEVLKRIESSKNELGHREEADVHGAGMSHSDVHPPLTDQDEVGTLNNIKVPPSPNSVTGDWNSESTTTPNVSS